MGGGVVGGEGEQSHALLGQRRMVRPGQGGERLDGQGGGVAVAGDPPGAAEEAVDEHGAQNPAVAGEQRHATAIGNDAASVSVGQQQVVVLGEEAGRGRSRSKISRSRVRPDQVCASLTVAGPNAAR